VPATDKLFVEWTGKNVSTLNYTVVNVEGQIILSGKLAQTHQALNVSSLANGMYLLRVTDDKGISDSRTFVKQ
jgi:hypothetical protein